MFWNPASARTLMVEGKSSRSYSGRATSGSQSVGRGDLRAGPARPLKVSLLSRRFLQHFQETLFSSWRSFAPPRTPPRYTMLDKKKAKTGNGKGQNHEDDS